MSLFSGQGSVFNATRDSSGNPVNFAWAGNSPDTTVSLSTENLEHKESYSGNRLTDARIVTETSASVAVTIDHFKEANFVLGLYGAAAAVSGGAIVDEPVLTTIPVVGERYALKSTGRVSAVSLEGNNVAISNTLYDIDASGVIVFSDITGIAAPITASYTNAAARRVGAFKTSAPERYTRVVSLNTATPTSGGDFTRRVFNMFRTRYDPTENLGLINDEFASMVLNGSVLADTLRAQSDAGGQFLEMIDFDPA